MRTKIVQRDGELLIVIPKDIAASENLLADSEVEVTTVREHLTLEELVDGITEENRHGETDWGPPVGNEVW